MTPDERAAEVVAKTGRNRPFDEAVKIVADAIRESSTEERQKLFRLEEICLEWLALFAMTQLPPEIQEIRLRMADAIGSNS